MSRSGLVGGEDLDPLVYGRWRGQVESSIRGKRGQSALKEILSALDAMPVKELAMNSLVNAEGQYCTLGVLGAARGLDMENIAPNGRESVAKAFNLTKQMAAEIMDLNDECINPRKVETVEICGPVKPRYPDWGHHEKFIWSDDECAPKKRWEYMREWVAGKIIGEQKFQ